MASPGPFNSEPNNCWAQIDHIDQLGSTKRNISISRLLSIFLLEILPLPCLHDTIIVMKGGRDINTMILTYWKNPRTICIMKRQKGSDMHFHTDPGIRNHHLPLHHHAGIDHGSQYQLTL